MPSTLDLYLRIAPELFLKRCVVGGIEQVFEINRNFRNEGVDATHSPEFTMLEAYEAYGDYDTMAVLTRELVQEAAASLTDGSHVVTHVDGTEFDLGGEWASITLFGSLSRRPRRGGHRRDADGRAGAATPRRHDVEVAPHFGPGQARRGDVRGARGARAWWRPRSCATTRRRPPR